MNSLRTPKPLIRGCEPPILISSSLNESSCRVNSSPSFSPSETKRAPAALGLNANPGCTVDFSAWPRRGQSRLTPSPRRIFSCLQGPIKPSARFQFAGTDIVRSIPCLIWSVPAGQLNTAFFLSRRRRPLRNFPRKRFCKYYTTGTYIKTRCPPVSSKNMSPAGTCALGEISACAVWLSASSRFFSPEFFVFFFALTAAALSPLVILGLGIPVR